MAVKVAINGFGRIGRLAFRQMFGAEGFEIAGELLKSCGFRYYTEFENRKAVFRRIP